MKSTPHKIPDSPIHAARVHLLFLPPDSPDPNPIEQLFAKLEHLLRVACERAIEAAWHRIGHLLGHVSTQECANHLKHADYVLPDVSTLQARRPVVSAVRRPRVPDEQTRCQAREKG